MAWRKTLKKVSENRPLRVVVLVICLLAVLSLVGLLWWHDSKDITPSFNVRLSVLSEGGEPQKNVTIRGPIDTANQPVETWGENSVTTDDAGMCELPELSPGSYWLMAERGSAMLNIPQSAKNGQVFTVTLDSRPIALTLRVTDEDGDAQPNRAISLLPDGMTGARDFERELLGQTDWQGNCLWSSGYAGAHLLAVEDAIYPIILEPNDNKKVTASITYTEDSEKEYRRTISFKKKNGSPLANENVSVVEYSRPGGKECLILTTQTDGAGSISLSGLSVGEHTIRVAGKRYKFSIPRTDAPETGAVEILLS